MAATTASLDGLPPEPFNAIIEIVSAAKSPLAPLAATSRACQWQVEQVTFKSLTCSHLDLPKLDTIVDIRRFSVLRSLTYDVTDLLDDDDVSDDEREMLAVRVTDDEIDANNEAFTAGIRDLLTLLHDKSKSSEKHPGVTLTIIGARYETESYLVSSPGIDPLDQRYLECAWVCLLESSFPNDLVADVVTHFECTDQIEYHTGKIWPASWIALLARFPKLKSASITLLDNERKSIGSRHQARDALGASLKMLPSSLKKLAIYYDYCLPPMNQFLDPSSLVAANAEYDILSHELGTLSNRLTNLDIQGATLSLKDFFNATNQSSSLQSLNFYELQAASPHGEWYFTLDPRVSMDDFREEHFTPGDPTLEELRDQVRSGDLPENELPAVLDIGGEPFRTVMDPTKFNDIYYAIAQALKRMKGLQELDMGFLLVGQADFGSGDHQFKFYRSSTLGGWRSISTADMVAIWGTFPDMEDLDQPMQSAWREIATEEGSSIDLLVGRCDFRDEHLKFV